MENLSEVLDEIAARTSWSTEEQRNTARAVIAASATGLDALDDATGPTTLAAADGSTSTSSADGESTSTSSASSRRKS